MPPRLILLIGDFLPAKLVELTPCGHRSEKKPLSKNPFQCLIFLNSFLPRMDAPLKENGAGDNIGFISTLIWALFIYKLSLSQYELKALGYNNTNQREPDAKINLPVS
jgi:hypothetical protein